MSIYNQYFGDAGTEQCLVLLKSDMTSEISFLLRNIVIAKAKHLLNTLMQM